MLTENGMIDERYELAAEVLTLRSDNERLERELAEARELLNLCVDADYLSEIPRDEIRGSFAAAKEGER